MLISNKTKSIVDESIRKFIDDYKKNSFPVPDQYRDDCSEDLIKSRLLRSINSVGLDLRETVGRLAKIHEVPIPCPLVFKLSDNSRFLVPFSCAMFFSVTVDPYRSIEFLDSVYQDFMNQLKKSRLTIPIGDLYLSESSNILLETVF